MDIERVFPALSFDGMTDMAFPDDGSNRLFLTLQPGRIMVFHNDQSVSSAETFLDIREQVNDRGNEEGLLGLAFDPDYSNNDHFYVYYSATDPRRSVISRFNASSTDASRADPDSEQIVLEVDQPFSNHNGGQLKFGPDGFLYISLGDGGSRADPQGNGQNLSTLLGSILRIDTSTLDDTGAYSIPPDNPFAGRGGSVREEIWAYGLRNPWRFSFDRETGVLWSADVGQNEFEEVDIIEPGNNYGWNVMEGFHCFQPTRNCNEDGLTLPVAEYDHRSGCSVTGGFVYRGNRLPSLYGAYIYGDFCSGNMWALRHNGSEVTEQMRIMDSSLSIASFGEDQSGEPYILSFDTGIYRFVPH
jgi:glucose/arabinose dehydrogenase